MITLGGDAELELVDSLDPFSGGRCCGHTRCQRAGQRLGRGRSDGAGGLHASVQQAAAAQRPPPRSAHHPPAHSPARPAPACRGHPVQRAAAQEVVEEHCQPERRREDAELAEPGVCAAPLQAHAALRHGRDRRRAGCAAWLGGGGGVDKSVAALQPARLLPALVAARPAHVPPSTARPALDRLRPTAARASCLPVHHAQTLRTCRSWGTTSRSAPRTRSL